MKSKTFLALSIFMSMVIITGKAFGEQTSFDELQCLKSLPSNNESFLINQNNLLDNNHWAYKTLENISKKHGIIVGNSNEKFDLNKPLSRNEAAVLLISLVGKIQEDKIQISEAEKVQLDILRQEFKNDLDKLTGRVNSLENSVSQLNGSIQKLESNDKKSIKVNIGEDFKIRGAFQFRYAGAVNKGVDNYATNFRLPLTELDFVGKLNKNLHYLAILVPSRNYDSSTNGVLSDAYVMTDKIKNHKIFLGLLRTPIGYEGVIPPFYLDFPDKAQISRNFSDFRDLGVKISGSYPVIDYSLSTFNGNNYNRNDTNNSSLAYGGWVVLKPFYKMPKFGKLEIGGGNYSGKYSKFSGTSYTGDMAQSTNSLYSSYEYKRNKITAEWSGKKGYNVSERKASGWYLEEALFLNKKKTSQLVARFDMFDPNHSLNNDKQSEYTLGYNHYIHGQNLKVQLDAVHVNNEAGKDSDRFILQTQYMF